MNHKVLQSIKFVVIDNLNVFGNPFVPDTCTRLQQGNTFQMLNTKYVPDTIKLGQERSDTEQQLTNFEFQFAFDAKISREVASRVPQKLDVMLQTGPQ